MSFGDEVVSVTIAIIIADLFMLALKGAFNAVRNAGKCTDPRCKLCNGGTRLPD